MKSLNCSNGCLAKLQRKHLRHLQATKVIPSHPQKTQLQLGQMQQLKLTGQHEQLGTMSLMLLSVGASQMQKCLCVVCLCAYLPWCFSWQPWNTYTGNASHGWRATAWHMLYWTLWAKAEPESCGQHVQLHTTHSLFGGRPKPPQGLLQECGRQQKLARSDFEFARTTGPSSSQGWWCSPSQPNKKKSASPNLQGAEAGENLACDGRAILRTIPSSKPADWKSGACWHQQLALPSEDLSQMSQSRVAPLHPTWALCSKFEQEAQACAAAFDHPKNAHWRFACTGQCHRLPNPLWLYRSLQKRLRSSQPWCCVCPARLPLYKDNEFCSHSRSSPDMMWCIQENSSKHNLWG